MKIIDENEFLSGGSQLPEGWDCGVITFFSEQRSAGFSEYVGA